MGNVSLAVEEGKQGSEGSGEAAAAAATDSEEECVDEEYLHSPEWIQKEKHVFILSESGKPIYTRFGMLYFCVSFSFCLRIVYHFCF